MDRTRKFLARICYALLLAPFVVQADVECNNINTKMEPSTSNLIDNNDGTITAPDTNLTWKKCAEGQTWVASNNTCSGTPLTFSWQQGLQHVGQVNQGTFDNRGHNDWRVPNIKELVSAIEFQCWQPSINEAVFPTTYFDSYYMTSSVSRRADMRAYSVSFNSGRIFNLQRADNRVYYLRLVRGF